MTKVHGKRYAYKFDFHGLMVACQAQAQGCDPTASLGMISPYKVGHNQHHHHHYPSQSHSLHHHSPSVHADHISTPATGSSLSFLSPSTAPSPIADNISSSTIANQLPVGNLITAASNTGEVATPSSSSSTALTAATTTLSTRNNYWPYTSPPFETRSSQPDAFN